MLNLPKTIKWVITDFDGVITDNFVYISDDFSKTRRVNFQDIIGINNLYKNGYTIAIISGEHNAVIDILKEKYQLKEVHTKIRNKLEVLKNIIEKYSLTQDDYLYIGDDINDLECLKYAKYKITLPHAVDEVKSVEDIQITERQCGFGAFREVADCLIH